MHHTSWLTRHQFASERAAWWSRVNERYFGRLHVANLDDGPLDAALEVYEVGALRMYRIEAPAHSVWRDAACGELPTDDCYKLVVQVRGRGVVEQRDRQALLEPGGWVVYDPRAPYAITNSERCTLLVAQVPRERLAGLTVGPHVGRIGAGNLAGLHGVFGSYLCSLNSQLAGLPDGAGQAICESVLGLLGSTLAEHRHGGEPLTSPAILRLRVRQFIESRLCDPKLSISRIAQAMGCSTRYLHMVFEGEEASLERLIWTARLERCHAALRDGRQASRSAAEVAYACGFKSTAHFARLFKRQYGVTPGNVQREARRQSGESIGVS